jgi:hypothetical protein
MSFTPILPTMLNTFYNDFMFNTLTGIHNTIITKPETTNDEIYSAIYYSLYGNYGIRRKIIANNAVILNYQKKHNKYDRNNVLSRLFRSVTINPQSMAITSMGIPQSLALNDTLLEQLTGENFAMLYRCESFDIGTMIIYNKDRTYTYTHHDYEEDIDETVTLDASISTRSKIGTGSYNTDMTHRYYFEKNNLVDPTNIIDLKKIPDELKHTTLVFNMRHESEHVGRISSNTLVAAYQMNAFANEMALIENWTNILTLVKNMSITKELFSDTLRLLLQKQYELSHVETLNIKDIRNKLSAAGVGHFNIPRELVFTSLNDVEEFVSKQDFHEQGVMIWLPNGDRTKVRNPRFTYVRNLCYNHPINPSPLNQKNLFKIYWNLQLENKVPDFLKYYETPDYRYNFIFNYFHTSVYQFANILFNTYQELHVYKRITNDKVLKFLKPLCYELHGKYLATKEPITRDVVMAYIKDMEVWALYGRVFTPIC